MGREFICISSANGGSFPADRKNQPGSLLKSQAVMQLPYGLIQFSLLSQCLFAWVDQFTFYMKSYFIDIGPGRIGKQALVWSPAFKNNVVGEVPLPI